MSHAVLDDHLLRDLLADDAGGDLRDLLRTHQPATTNLFYLRLCRSVVAARGGQLTGRWSSERRQTLGRSLVDLPETVAIVPFRPLVFRIAQLAGVHRLSTLGAEAVAAAQHLGAPLCVWAGDDGPGIRASAVANHLTYRSLNR